MSNLPESDSSDPYPRVAASATMDISERVATLRHSRLCHGLSVEELHDLAVAVHPVAFAAGQIVCQQDDPGGSMFLVAHGRVKLAIAQGPGNYRLLDYLGRGDHFGDMAMLTGRRRMATATAVVDTELLELHNDDFQRLLETVPAFAANLSRTMGFRLHLVTHGKPVRWQPKVIALVNSTQKTQGLIRPLAETLALRDSAFEVLTDREQIWQPENGYALHQIPTDSASDRWKNEEELLRRAIQQHDRVLVDVTQRQLDTELPRLLRRCEQIWWLVEPRFAETSLANLATLLATDRSLAPRVHLVWFLPEAERFAPLFEAEKLGISPLDFKVVLPSSENSPNIAQRQSISRLVRHLQGTRIGLALSGGGSRGLAHLGALRALERAGIDFDLMAGASSGAMTGISYAAGWPPDEALRLFKQDVTPPWLLRSLPAASLWYLYAMFRFGAWDRKLRAYAGDARLEQLRIPFSTVTVDLVSGRPVIRDRGDCVHAILESINMPTIAPPILRDGMALVDGGILNNLPGDVLAERGAALVVGVDVGARLPQRFGKRLFRRNGSYRRPRLWETLLRVNEVQASGVNTISTASIDLMIEPDASAFDFSDFTKGFELAEIGEAATEEAIPQLKQLIADLERPDSISRS